MRAALLTAAGVAFLAVAGPAGAKPREKPCGTRALYGKELSLWVVGEPISCAKARFIARPKCRDRRPWTCLSLDSWQLGPERDSFIRIDSEYLGITYTRGGVVRHASIFQG